MLTKSSQAEKISLFKIAKVVAIGLVATFGAQGQAFAQAEFPEAGHPFTLVQNFAAGGTIQRAMQDFQPFFEEELGTRTVIETIEGAAGLIGYNEVFQRPADGYTIIGGSSTFGPHVFPYLAQTPPPWKYEDFKPLGIYSDIPNSGMLVLADSPFETFPDFVAAAKADPGGITVGTIGPGRVEDVQILELQEFFGIEVNHVYYDSGGTLFTDLLTGDLDVIVTAVLRYTDNDDVRIVTLLAKEMSDKFPYPETSIMADWQEELGYDVADLRTLGSTHFNSMMVRSDVSDEVFDRLALAFKNVVTNPEWQERVKEYRYPVYYTPEKAQAIYDEMREGITNMIALTGKSK